jgi:hypothetical protein
MKNYLLYLLLIPLLNVFPQNLNQTITDEESGEPILIGYCTREAFSDSVFSVWFNSEYSNYQVDTLLLSKNRNNINGVEITLVMGTWCSDSRREVPRFYKILDHLGFPDGWVTCINVNRDKKTLVGELEQITIDFVPTIIFYQSGIELGRIIESPVESLEKDMLKILLKE